MHQNIPSDCKRNFLRDFFFNAGLNLFLLPDESLIALGK
jgi:hypothetical protein